MHKIGSENLQCVNKHNAKLEYPEMKTVGAKEYTNHTPPQHLEWKKNV